LIHNYSDVPRIERRRGGLASWQQRIAKEVLFARICDLRLPTNSARLAACRPDISSGLFGSPLDARRTNG
jgi:hypothetical protein